MSEQTGNPLKRSKKIPRFIINDPDDEPIDNPEDMDTDQPVDESNEFLKQQLELMKFYESSTLHTANTHEPEKSPAQSSPAPQPSNPMQPQPHGEQDVNFGDAYIKEQMEALRFFEEKRKREAEDARVAALLAKEAPPISLPPQPPGSHDQDLLLALKFEEEEAAAAKKARAEADAAVAKKFYEEEQARLNKLQQSVAADAELARKLVAEEEQKAKQDSERKEWEKTMNVIRMEAKSEADAELARLVREKEELENRLRAAQSMPAAGATITLQGVQYPEYWQPQNASHQSFDVPPNSEEWKWIQKRFHEGVKNKIHRIERNQNKELWMWYWLKKQQLVAKNKAIGANEKYVFHGSRNDAYNIILKEGFDHRVANMGGAIGAGVYFAHNSATSSGYVGNHGAFKKMLFCYVAAGDVGPGAHGLRRPPEKKRNTWFGGGAVAELYDSVGNEGGVYVVFDNYQAFPAYVIHYQ